MSAAGPPCAAAVLAAWCDHAEHLGVPTAEQVDRQRSELEASAAGRGGPADAPGQGVQLLAIQQKSVDLLLREYFQMVKAQQQEQQRRRRAGPTWSSSGGSLGQALFLLLCPALPDWCDLEHIAAACVALACALASAVVVMGCVLVPIWLAVLRELLQRQQPGRATAVAVGGLALMAASDVMHRRSALARRAAADSTVTPPKLRAALAGVAGADQGEALAALRKWSKTTPARLSRPGAAQQHQHAAAASSPAAAPAAATAAAASAAAPGGGGPQPQPALQQLLPDLAALHAALGVRPSGGAPPASREQLAEELTRLCGAVGVPCSASAASGAPAQLIAQLKASIGI